MFHGECYPGPQGETEAGGGGGLPGQPGRGPQPEPGAEQQAAAPRQPVRRAPAAALHAGGDIGGRLRAPLPGLAQQECGGGAAPDALRPGAHAARGALQAGTPAFLVKPPSLGWQTASEQCHRCLVLLQQEHSVAEEPVPEEESRATRLFSFVKAH